MKLPCKHSPLNTGEMPPSAHLPPTAFHVPHPHICKHHTLHAPCSTTPSMSHIFSPTKHHTKPACHQQPHNTKLMPRAHSPPTAKTYTDLKYWRPNTSTFLPPALNPCSPQRLYTHWTFSPWFTREPPLPIKNISFLSIAQRNSSSLCTFYTYARTAQLFLYAPSAAPIPPYSYAVRIFSILIPLVATDLMCWTIISKASLKRRISLSSLRIYTSSR